MADNPVKAYCFSAFGIMAGTLNSNKPLITLLGLTQIYESLDVFAIHPARTNTAKIFFFILFPVIQSSTAWVKERLVPYFVYNKAYARKAYPGISKVIVTK